MIRARTLLDAARVLRLEAAHLETHPDECPLEWSPLILEVRARALDLEDLASVLEGAARALESTPSISRGK